MFNKGVLGALVAVVVGIYYFTIEQRAAPSLFSTPEAVRAEIETVFLETWRDYASHGWPYDVYSPMGRSKRNMPRSGDPMGWIIVDALDTMFMMYNSSTENRNELLKDILEVQVWVDNELSYDIDAEVNIFETTIRMLGGLLSAHYYASELKIGNPGIYLNKAIDLCDRLSLAFEKTESGIPYSSVNLHTGEAIKNHVDDGASSTAEFTTLQMEFKYLSYLTGNTTYWKLAEQVYPALYKKNNLLDGYQGLAPIYTYPDSGVFMGQNIRFGSRGDSFYEYLLKQYLLTHEKLYYDLYRHSMEGMKRLLVAHSKPNKLAYIGEKPFGVMNDLDPKMDHLVCFMGGLLAMGATEGESIDTARQKASWNSQKEEDWRLAQDLTHTCYQMYHQSPSGLAPEIVVFNDGRPIPHNAWMAPSEDFYVKPADRHNLQRPETVESIMFLYHLTKDDKYRQWGYEIFSNFAKNTCQLSTDYQKIYVSLKDCISVPTVKSDNIESFWLAETLKYLYLLFQDDVDLTKVVFNTEAHPFPKLNPEKLRELGLRTGWSP